MLIETSHNFTVSLEKVPKTLEIESQTYRFLCCNFKASRNHFKGIYYICNKFIEIDDRNTNRVIENQSINSVDLCFYILE